MCQPTLLKYAGVAELADALDLGSSSSECRFKSCHPHQKRRCVQYYGLLRFFVFIIYFSFGAIPILDVCSAYEVLFAIRRPNATNYAMFHPHQKTETCPMFRTAPFFLFYFRRHFFVLVRFHSLMYALHTKSCLLFVGRTRRITQCFTRTKRGGRVSWRCF